MVTNYLRPLLLTVSLIFASVTCLAETSEGITLSLDNADVADLIRWASDVTDKNIILHPNVQGRVTVIAGEPMSQREAYEVFLSVLQVHGLTVIEENGSLKVIPDAQAKQSAIPLASDTLSGSSEDVVVQIVRVKNISATNVINLLRPLVPQTGYLAAYPQTNTIIVADRSSNIQKLLNIINRIDQVGTIDIELIALEFADAKEVITVLSKLLPKQTAGQDQGSSPFNLAVDERSNSILMTGDPVTRQQIRSLVKRLDQPLEGDGNTQVVRIQYATAADLVPLLQSISGSVQKGAKAQGITDVDVSIQAHEQLNALVITAPPSLLTTMRVVIKQLDVPRAQVLVEALIVEVSEDLSHKIGVEWRTNSVNEGTNGVLGGFRSFPGGVAPLSVGDDTQLNLGSGLSLGYFRDGDLRAIINLLAGETNANILSTPSIVSLDNEEAEILVGSNVPFITGSQQRAGDIDPFQTIQREDIGIILKVKPRINNNNSVTLDIEQSIESIVPSLADTADIVTNKREIKTRVLIGDDEILVLGGLMRDDITDNVTKVPILGDIPLLGRLFKSQSTTVTKTNLMVFIHPRILHSSDSLRHISKDKYNMIRDSQMEFDGNMERFWFPGSAPLLPEFPESQGSPESKGSPELQGAPESQGSAESPKPVSSLH
ncbi:MAG: type II secretion system secretin GspD [Porticoccus sp.]|nr:type II secretion system secretin GspD [Porticoccus sp.]